MSVNNICLKGTFPLLAQKYHTLPDVARLANVTRRMVNVWISTGRLPASKIGPMWVVEQTDLDTFLASYSKWSKNGGQR